jgi:hypothetical protein
MALAIGSEDDEPGSRAIFANANAIGAVKVRRRVPGSTTTSAISSRAFSENSSTRISATIVGSQKFALEIEKEAWTPRCQSRPICILAAQWRSH